MREVKYQSFLLAISLAICIKFFYQKFKCMVILKSVVGKKKVKCVVDMRENWYSIECLSKY